MLANTTCQYSYFESRWHKRFMDKAEVGILRPAAKSLASDRSLSSRSYPGKSRGPIPWGESGPLPADVPRFFRLSWKMCQASLVAAGKPENVPRQLAYSRTAGATILIAYCGGKDSEHARLREACPAYPAYRSRARTFCGWVLQSIAPRYQLAPGSGHASRAAVSAAKSASRMALSPR